MCAQCTNVSIDILVFFSFILWYESCLMVTLWLKNLLKTVSLWILPLLLFIFAPAFLNAISSANRSLTGKREAFVIAVFFLFLSILLLSYSPHASVIWCVCVCVCMLELEFIACVSTVVKTVIYL